MFRAALSGLLITASVVLSAPVPEPTTKVVGPLPTFLNLSEAKIVDQVIKNVPMVVEMGGQKITRIQQVTEQVPVTRAFQVRLTDHEVVTAGGKTLTLEAALPLLKAAPLVLVSDGPLDPAFGKVLKPETIILIRKKK
jgi:hypothetical protein